LVEISQESLESREVDNRPEVRMKSFVEMKRFKERWKKAVRDDTCWVDPYWNPSGLSKPNQTGFFSLLSVLCGPLYTIILVHRFCFTSRKISVFMCFMDHSVDLTFWSIIQKCFCASKYL